MPRPLYPGERAAGTHWIGDWVGPRAGLHNMEKWKSLSPPLSLWRYSPNLGLGLPPWNYSFHFGLLDFRHSVGLLERLISSSQDLYTHRKPHTHKNQTYIPWVGLVGFEPMIPVSERAQTVHALDRSATVTGPTNVDVNKINYYKHNKNKVIYFLG
jgi:hypothetical protein